MKVLLNRIGETLFREIGWQVPMAEVLDVNERTLRLPRTPTVPGEPGGIVGNSVSTPFCSSTITERKRCGLSTYRPIALRRS